MAGNMWEINTGHNINNNEMFVVNRGGSCHDNGSWGAVIFAGGDMGLSYCSYFAGFRVVLYIV